MREGRAAQTFAPACPFCGRALEILPTATGGYIENWKCAPCQVYVTRTSFPENEVAASRVLEMKAAR